MPIIQFPEPQSLNILEIGDGKDHRTMTYSVEKPHPGYGKDPNILNEFGHSVYPKMIYPNGKDQPGFIVNNKEEENALLKSDQVNLREDGPIIDEFVAAGFKAKDYPPQGYKSKSTDAEIEAAIKKQSSSPW